MLNVDGTPNEAGQITEVVDLILRYRRHAERILFAVTGLGRKNVILGFYLAQGTQSGDRLGNEGGEVIPMPATLHRVPRRNPCREGTRQSD